MCTVDDTDLDGEVFIPREETPVLDRSYFCIKCHKEAFVCLRKKDFYCEGCLIVHVDHKCRSALGKSKLMKPTDKVLVGFSGSPASVVLLYILSRAVGQENHKKLMYSIAFCYVDDGGVRGVSLEKRKEIAENVQEIIESYGFEFHKAALTFGSEFQHEDETVSTLFSHLRSQTSKEDLLAKIRLRTLITVAHKLQCNKIFTAENQESLSVKLLSQFSLGMGEQLPQEVGFLNDSQPLRVLRPMAEIDNREISYYTQFLNLPAVDRFKEGNLASIQNLTRGFIHGLQDEYPSTVSTIYRTGAKCGVMRKLNSETVCGLCDAAHIVGETETPYSADEAMAFSESVSQSGTCGGELNKELDKLKHRFCHSCLTILKETGPDMLRKIANCEQGKPFALRM